MSDTKPLRDVAQHHREEADRRRHEARQHYRQAEKAQAAGHTRAASMWRAMATAEAGIAARQQEEADRLTMMADVYDEMPERPAK